jgi:high-affinity Fe2+/Pb2+ permease
MEVPPILRGESLTRLLQGAAIGAVATMAIGFYWGGWVTGGGAREMVHKSTSSAVVAALAPICVDKFQRSADPSANLIELKKVKSWQQDTFVAERGWATMPGAASPDSAVARVCAEMLNNLKL